MFTNDDCRNPLTVTRTTLDTCHVVIVHSCSITCIHVSCFLQSLSTQFFFYMYVPCIFVYFNSTCHVSFVSLHVCAMFLTIIPAANADFLPNFFKINCHIGIDAIEETLSKKKKKKIKPIITFKQKYVSIIGYSPSPFFLFYIFQGLSNSKCAMKCRLYKDRDLRCARIA